MSFKPSDAASALQEGINRAERLFNDLLHSHEAAPDALLRELEDLRFGVVQDFFRGIALLGSARNSGGGGVNQSAQQRLVANNFDVMLDARPVRDPIEQ